MQAEVDARQLARIRAGQLVRVTLPDGTTVDGKVRLVSPTLSTNTGRAIVYVALNGHDAQPGMFAIGVIELGKAQAWTLPESALVPRDGRTDVYVLNADGATVARRTVVTGRHRDGRCEIVSGLEHGVRVVASGGGFLSDGALVKVVQNKGLAGIAAAVGVTAGGVAAAGNAQGGAL